MFENMKKTPSRAPYNGMADFLYRYIALVSGSFIILVSLYLASLYNYLLFHSMAELFSIAISLAIFMFAWNTRRLLENDYLLFLGISYLIVSILDLTHTLGYKGMNIFPGYDTNLPTQLWIAARYVESISLLAAFFFLKRRLSVALCFVSFGLAACWIFAAIFYWKKFPPCFIEGTGLTPFKIISEYIISAILLVSLAALFQNRHHFHPKVVRLLAASIIVSVFSEMAFTFYVSAYGLSNLIGHYFKIISFYFIYRAIITTGLTKPLELLFYDLKKREEALQESRDLLETRVQERTKDLVAVNEQLQQEITERQQAQQELQKSEARLKAIFQAAEDVSFILMSISESPPRVIEFSPGAEHLFGYRRDDILNETVDRFYSPEDIQKLPEIFTRLRQGLRGFDGEMTLVRSSGESFPALVSYTPIQNSFNGMAALGVVIDITSSKEEQRKLRESEKKFRALFNDALDMIHIVDPSGNITDTNPVELQTLGYTREELIGKPLLDIIHPADKERTRSFLGQVLRGTAIKNYETALITKNSDRVDVEVSAVPQIEDGKVISARAIARDITEHKNLTAQLLQAQKMEAIGTLAGGIAHDFNNILSPILGYSELVAERLPENSEERNMVQIIQTSGKRATELVSQILIFSRQTEQQRQPLQIHLIIKEALKLLRSSIPTTIAIHQNVVDCGLVMADPTQVHQIIMNLCTNAYHAMRETGGELSVSMEVVELTTHDHLDNLALQPGPHVKLSVRDTGYGMSKELQERIFEPYFTTKRQGEGTGLGLSMVHGIVKSHNGHITVYSEPGKGTEFHVYLPQVLGHDEGLAKEAAGEILQGSGTVLVVDDEPIIGKMLKRMLSNMGYEVLICSSSTDAMKVFTQQREHIALVLTDMNMPVMNGAELARRIKQLSPAMPVVLCTGFSEIMDEKKARLMGIDGYMMKPVIQRQLAQTLHDILEKKGGSGPVV